MEVEAALTEPARNYPKRKKGRRQPGRRRLATPEPTVEQQDRLPLHPLLDEAVSILVDSREIILSLELTPRRLRILGEIRSWLRRAGWR